MKCLPRAQATGGVAFSHQRWVNFVQVCPDRLRSTPLTFWIENRRTSAVERRSRNSSLQREMHNGELHGRCSPGCSEKIWAVNGPAGDASETYRRNPRWSSQHVCCRQADGWKSQPAADHHTGRWDVQLWQEITMVDSLCLIYCSTFF